uniref:Putative secreted protein n=1 Tax=Ixodes ricinus TaxID=34613 RepID=V5HUV4_IXORI
MNSFIVVLVSSLVFDDVRGCLQTQLNSPRCPLEWCSSQRDCSIGQCCLETSSGDMALVNLQSFGRTRGRTALIAQNGDQPYQGVCPCELGYECVDGTCATTPEQPVAVE